MPPQPAPTSTVLDCWIFSFFFFFLMIRRPPRSTLFPYTNALPIYTIVADLVTQLTQLGAVAIGFDVIFAEPEDRKSTRLNSSHANISYAVFCLKKKNAWT